MVCMVAEGVEKHMWAKVYMGLLDQAEETVKIAFSERMVLT